MIEQFYKKALAEDATIKVVGLEFDGEHWEAVATLHSGDEYRVANKTPAAAIGDCLTLLSGQLPMPF